MATSRCRRSAEPKPADHGHPAASLIQQKHAPAHFIGLGGLMIFQDVFHQARLVAKDDPVRYFETWPPSPLFLIGNEVTGGEHRFLGVLIF